MILLLKTGKYCCIWCLVTSDQLRDPPQSVPARSTQSICDDFKSFTAAGADLKKAKQHNNVVRQPFFPGIPLTNVNYRLQLQ